MKVTIIPIVIGVFDTVNKELLQRLEVLDKRTSRDHPTYNTVENGQYTEKSHGDLRRLAVTQTPMENHQLKLMWKTLKE